jgi:hypothetical protein
MDAEKRQNEESKMKNKKPQWSFVVNNVDEIDVPRILREAPSESNWVVIADRRGVPVELFIRNSFLEQFEWGDMILVCKDQLRPGWGVRHLPYLKQVTGTLKAPIMGGWNNEDLPAGWRAGGANISHRGCVTPEDIRTLEKAKEFIRRIPVRVYTD